jgi:hypothetical protein
MSCNYIIGLWLLKLGALLNVILLLNTPQTGDPLIIVPAQIFFAVSAFRCLFPVRYEHHVVLHDSILSSIFLTRSLATVTEIAYIFQFSYVLRLIDLEHTQFVSALSWLMVAQVVICQFLVWRAILSSRLMLYFYEELGWVVIFAANTIASAYLYFGTDSPASHRGLLAVSLSFGAVYLPWQFIHLRMLLADASRGTVERASHGLRRAILFRNRRTDPQSWGGLVGLSWMVGYWATIMPAWIFGVVQVLAEH